MTTSAARITVRDLDMRYGDRVIQRDLTFTIGAGEIFVRSASTSDALRRLREAVERPLAVTRPAAAGQRDMRVGIRSMELPRHGELRKPGDTAI